MRIDGVLSAVKTVIRGTENEGSEKQFQQYIYMFNIIYVCHSAIE